MNLILAYIPWWAQALAVVFIVICLVLVLLVLLQKGKGGGLAAAFGGAGGQTAFGGKTGDVFTWITIFVVAAFLLLAMVLTVSYKPTNPQEYIDATSVVRPAAPGAAQNESAPIIPQTQEAPATPQNENPQQ